uniref:Uncharacterized protein n=1 Tax=Sus scrofa TaxID=9823 RepID=A0A8D1PFT8_PIG
MCLTWTCCFVLFPLFCLTPGHAKTYQAHIKEKFSNLWFQEARTRIHEYLDQENARKEQESLQRLFVDFLALCYCLYEMRNEDFVQWAMDFFQAVKLSIIDDADLVVSAYCLKHCSGLRTLWVSVLHDFEEEDEEGSTAIHWNQVCSALITNENLREFRMSDSSLHGFTFVTLCDQLKHPRCRLQKLHLNNVSFPRGSRLFFEVLTHSPHLKCLNLSGTKLSRNAVKLLCEALNNPTCNIEELLLARCWLSVEDCSAFSQILRSSRKLLNLNVSRNYLVPGAPLLCKVLCKPDCALRVLDLGHCYLDQHCWTNLYEVLLCNKSLIHLDLTSNILKDKKLKLLCEALKEPGCHLRSLILKCLITAAGCRELASVLPVNPNLRNLQLGYNDIEDTGVKLLCEGLTHPSCRLEILGWVSCPQSHGSNQRLLPGYLFCPHQQQNSEDFESGWKCLGPQWDGGALRGPEAPRVHPAGSQVSRQLLPWGKGPVLGLRKG